MKNFLKKLLVFSSILIIFSSITHTILYNNVSAGPMTQMYVVDDGGGGGSGNNNNNNNNNNNSQPTGPNCRYFLGLTSWDCGVTNPNNEESLTSNIWTIAVNILTDISVIAAYLVIRYVIYGGYLYMFSSGEAVKVSAGKKTLTHAFIGLAIVVLASIILGSIRVALIGNKSFENCVSSTAQAASCMNSSPEALVTNLISWVIGIAGAVAAIFLVVGGVGYVTSAGDANKLQKAKNTITYALIGLAIVGLSEIIVSVVSGIINSGTTPPTP